MLIDKLKTVWAAMQAHEFGPEPLVIEVIDGKVYVQTMTMSGSDGAHDGLYCEGEGKTLDEAFDSFLENLDKEVME